MKNQVENKGEVVIYKTESGQTAIDVRLEDETVWLTQKQMAELFQNTVANINIHIGRIYSEKELNMDSTIKESLIVQIEGNRQITRKINSGMQFITLYSPRLQSWEYGAE